MSAKLNLRIIKKNLVADPEIAFLTKSISNADIVRVKKNLIIFSKRRIFETFI